MKSGEQANAERRGIVVAWGLGLIMCVGIVGRMWCRVRRMLCRMHSLNTILEDIHVLLLLLFAPLPLRLRRG